MADFGAKKKLSSVGIKDLILPGEMKTILNQVVEAEKAAEAKLIKRRDPVTAQHREGDGR